MVSVPLTFIRDYTCPMAEQASWDRTRASVLPVTLPISTMWLCGYFQDDDQVKQNLQIGLICMIPGVLIGFVISQKTKPSRAPSTLLTIYAMLAFVMSVIWINFTSNCIMDML